MWLAAFLALITTAVVLRLVGLDERSLFRDEAASWLEARYSLPVLLERAAGEPYPPLYALLLHGWIRVFGDGEAALRLPSVLAGIGMVLAGWRWSHEALGRWAGLVTLVAMAFSPLAIANARDARMYALEALFATVAWWMVWRLVSGRAGGRRVSAAHVLVLAAAVAGELWTLSLGVVVAGLQGLVVLAAVIVARRRSDTSAARARSGAQLALAALLVGCLSFVPWLPSAVASVTSGEPFWTAVPGTFDWVLTWQVALVGWRGDTISNLATASLLLFALVGAVWLVRAGDPDRRWLGWLILGGAALVPAVWAISLVRSIYDHRYFGAAVGPLALAVAAGVAAILERLTGRVEQRRQMRWIRPAGFATAVALVALLTAPFGVDWLTTWRSPSNSSPVRDLISAIAPRVRPGDTLLAIDARAYFPVAYEIHRAVPVDRRLAMPVLDWASDDEPRYHGASLIETSAKVDDAMLRRLGARAALRLGPEGRVWLLASGEEAGGELDHAVLALPGAVPLERLVLGAERYEPAQAVLIALLPE
jgi:4-amino-4-deoxy-L-arabinose transferase-like glycosyltransferase